MSGFFRGVGLVWFVVGGMWNVRYCFGPVEKIKIVIMIMDRLRTHTYTTHQ